MLKLKIEKIADGIIRIRDDAHADTLSLSERYDIVHADPVESNDGIVFDEASSSVKLPNGKLLKFSFRDHEDDEFWSEASAFVNDKFKDYHLNKIVVEGKPDDAIEADAENYDIPAVIPQGEVHFGACVEVGDTERFYGLGEASRDKLELRGRAYQNWTYYQFDEIPTPFFMSSEGWGILINAAGRHFVDICEQYSDKVIMSGENDPLDIFVFYGTMPEILKLYSSITGKSMMLPGWAYGLTYVNPIHANQYEVMSDAERFRKEQIPVDNFSLEPAWQTIFYDYSNEPQWNLEKFHVPAWLERRGREDNPDHFISALKRMGIHTSLWFCDDYDLTDEAERQFRGDDDNKFEPWNKRFDRFTNIGVDGYKIDPADTVWKCSPSMICANGLPQMHMHNLNQVLITKQTYEGFVRNTGIRPMHHYCGGYIGSQKWSACNTGDNGGGHGSMIWLMTLAMSGYSNSTIDMHIFAPDSIHFGFFVSWAHLNAWQGIRQPWWAGDDMYDLFKYYAKLRYQLFPYIYSAALEAHEEAMPVVRPLPLVFPEFEGGFDNNTQYMFGPYFMVCAYTDTAHLPEGEWEDYWTGKLYHGPCTIPATYPEGRGGALYIKRGAIIPKTHGDMQCVEQYDRSVVEIDIYPEGHSEYILREDDMVSLNYETQTSCHTLITCDADADTTNIVIGKGVGDYEGKPAQRKFIVNIYGGSKNVKVTTDAADTYEIVIKR